MKKVYVSNMMVECVTRTEAKHEAEIQPVV